MNAHLIEAFLEAAASLMNLSPQARQHLSGQLNARRFAPRHLLLPDGHAFDGIFIVHAGLVRGLYDGPSGNDISAWFVAEGDFIPPVYALPDGRPAFKSVEILEESTLVWLNRDELGELYGHFPETFPFKHRISGLHLARVTELLRALRTHTNAELYQWLLDRYPWASRVKGIHLAPFMGITPQSLSGIRGGKH